MHGLSHWVPLHTTGTQTRAGDTYNFRGNMAVGVQLPTFPYEKTPIYEAYPVGMAQKDDG